MDGRRRTDYGGRGRTPVGNIMDINVASMLISPVAVYAHRIFLRFRVSLLRISAFPKHRILVCRVFVSYRFSRFLPFLRYFSCIILLFCAPFFARLKSSFPPFFSFLLAGSVFRPFPLHCLLIFSSPFGDSFDSKATDSSWESFRRASSRRIMDLRFREKPAIEI